ncbi:MAG: TetR-like C-terminal domain-containing protein [Clostridiaceae bacterium]|nr:TetR-like C-terminal domain-containing protein [Clostridiaceae bacterium]
MENQAKRPDRRVIKTKKAIRNAFAELLSEKDINNITIKEISDAADINRKTFYNYYNGVYQIVEEIEDEIVTAFEAVLKGVDFRQCLQSPYVIFTKLTSSINKDIKFYSCLLKKDGNTSLSAKIVATLKIKVKESFASQISVSENILNLIADFSIAGMVAVFQEWFNSGCKMPIEQLSDAVGTMTFSGINGLLKDEAL